LIVVGNITINIPIAYLYNLEKMFIVSIAVRTPDGKGIFNQARNLLQRTKCD